mmetsp:Transcript_35877/g.50821  ORF Transcript_35877/g.50821 Transcript_35877/m.50821 type:complete len:212 (+) Transcript_35877:223-858(+)
MGYSPSEADPDVWMRATIKPNGEECYEYVLTYVDDCLSVSHDPQSTMDEIGSDFQWKGDKVQPPETYLGARLQEKILDGKRMWTMTSTDYVKTAVTTIEERLHKRGLKMVSKAITPMSSNFVPELDSSPELDADDITFFQGMIGILRWATEIGRVDILTEVSMMSQFQASPRHGHLEEAFHIFAFLKKNPKLTLHFNPGLAKIDPNIFQDN